MLAVLNIGLTPYPKPEMKTYDTGGNCFSVSREQEGAVELQGGGTNTLIMGSGEDQRAVSQPASQLEASKTIPLGGVATC